MEIYDVGKSEKYSQMALPEFSAYFLRERRENLLGFNKYFKVAVVILAIQITFGLLTVLVVMAQSGLIGALAGIINLASFVLFLWFARLAKHFVTLSLRKTENDIHNTLTYREGSAEMADQILDAARNSAKNKITVNGDNAILAIEGGSVSNVNQSKSVEGGAELISDLALLISYCEQSGSKEAETKAIELAEEASKGNPDKGKIFSLWSGITAVIPQISAVVQIAQSVQKLVTG